MAEHINEQARIRMRDLILDGTGDGQANVDMMSVIRAAQLEVNVQPEMGVNNLMQNPIGFPRVRRRFLIPNRERRSASPPLAARRTRASQRRASAQRMLERRASVQRLYARRNLNQQTASARRTNTQRYSARHLSTLQRRRRALSANQASRLSDAPSNQDQSFTSGSTAIAIPAGANATPASAVAASSHTPLTPPPLPATSPPSAPVQARVAPTRLRFTNSHVSPALRSRSRPLMRTMIRWRHPQNHEASSSTSDESTNTLITTDAAVARPGSTPFRSLMRSLPNRSAAPPAATQRVNNNNSPLTTITSRLGSGSDISFSTSESDTDTVHSISRTPQTPSATNSSVPSSEIRTANLAIQQNRPRIATDNPNILNSLSSSENSETGSTQISTSSSQ